MQLPMSSEPLNVSSIVVHLQWLGPPPLLGARPERCGILDADGESALRERSSHSTVEYLTVSQFAVMSVCKPTSARMFQASFLGVQ